MRAAVLVFVMLFAAAARAQPPAAAAGPQTPAQPQPAAPNQTPPTAASVGPEAPGPAAQTLEASPAGDYTYQPEGRRDPFLSLLGTGTEQRGTGTRLDGAAGLAVAEISVRGVVQHRGALIAMIQGPDNKTYVIHQGDKLLDGTIKAVTKEGLVITQEVNDPLSLVKQRELVKRLKSLEEAKE